MSKLNPHNASFTVIVLFKIKSNHLTDELKKIALITTPNIVSGNFNFFGEDVIAYAIQHKPSIIVYMNEKEQESIKIQRAALNSIALTYINYLKKNFHIMGGSY